MPAALGPRFVLEAGFLILLAVVVGFADLRPALIILVMAVAWLLVSLIEYFAWRQGPRVAPMRHFGPAEPAAAGVIQEAVEEAPPPPPPPPPPLPRPAEEETVITPASAEPAEPEQVAEPSSESERRLRHRLEPLQPRPRRRWLFFGRHDRSEQEGAGDEGEEER